MNVIRLKLVGDWVMMFNLGWQKETCYMYSIVSCFLFEGVIAE